MFVAGTRTSRARRRRAAGAPLARPREGQPAAPRISRRPACLCTESARARHGRGTKMLAAERRPARRCLGAKHAAIGEGQLCRWCPVGHLQVANERRRERRHEGARRHGGPVRPWRDPVQDQAAAAVWRTLCLINPGRSERARSRRRGRTLEAVHRGGHARSLEGPRQRAKLKSICGRRTLCTGGSRAHALHCSSTRCAADHAAGDEATEKRRRRGFAPVHC